MHDVILAHPNFVEFYNDAIDYQLGEVNRPEHSSVEN